MIECVMPTNVSPIDDIELASLVIGMTRLARSVKRGVQAMPTGSRLTYRGVAGKALFVAHTLAGFMAQDAAFR